MSRDLKLDVVLRGIDKVTKPLKKITQGSGKTAEALRASREQLKSLERAQKDLRGFKELKRQASESGDALKAQRDRVKQLSRQLRTNQGDTAALTQERDRAIRKARELTRQHEDQTEKARRMRQGLRETHGMTGRLSDAERDLGRKIRSTTDDIDQQRQKLRGLADAQKRAQQASDQFHRGIGRANSIRGAGMTGLATGGAALYAGARVLAPGVAYGEQMSAVQAVGRFEKDDERFQALKQQSRDLGSSTAFSASEVGAGQEFLLRAGMSAEAIKSSMGDVLDLALANNTELGRTADIASNIAGTFKIDLEEDGSMGRVADILSATASRANVDLEKLGETVKYLGGAEDLDLSLEQATAMAGMLGNIGIQGSQAGTTLRGMMNRLTDPTAKAAGVIESLGLQVSNADGEMRELPEILRDINAATKDLGNADRKQALQQIFGAEAGSGMAELVSQMSTGALDELIEKLEIANGENARMARTMEDNIGGDLKGLRSAWEEVGISITDTNDGPLRDLIQSVTTITRGVGNWIKQNPELAGGLAKAAAGLAALVAVGGAFTIMLASILGPIVAVRYGLEMMGIKTGGLGGKIYRFTSKILPSLGEGLSWIGRVLATVGRAFQINPIGLAVTAIAVSALLIYKYWQPITAFFSGVFKGIRKGFAPLADAIRPAFAALAETLEPLAPIWDAVCGALGKVWGWVTDLLSPMEATKEELGAATSAGERFGEWLASIVTFFPRLIVSFSRLGTDVVRGLFGNLRRGIANGWADIKAAFDGGIAGVARLLVNWSPLGLVYKAITGTLDALGVEVPASMASLADAIVTGLDAARGGIGRLWDWFKQAPGRAIDHVVGLVSDWDLTGQLREKWDEAIAYLKALPSRMWDAGRETAAGLADGIKNGASSVADGATDMARGAVDSVRNFLDIHSPSRVMRRIGEHTVEGLNQGIDRRADEPVKRVTDMTKRLKKAGAGLALGATMSLPAAAMPPVPDVPAQRLEIQSPTLPNLGELRAPRIQSPAAPVLPELPAQRLEIQTPAMPTLDDLGPLRLEAPELPALPALRLHVERPDLSELTALRASLDTAVSIRSEADAVPIDNRPPVASQNGGNVQINIGDINVNAAPGMDEQALARYVADEVKKALANAERDAAARRRRNLYDND